MEIKFRAYIKSLKWIVPVERINFDTQTVEVDLTDGNGDTCEYDFEEVELLQFTGFRDEKGDEIYEGDKLLLTTVYDDFNDEEVVECGTGVVEFYEGKWIVASEEYDDEDLYDWILGYVVVIGNIHRKSEAKEDEETD